MPFLPIIPLFYFLFILPQQQQEKKRRAMIDSLKKNDKVLTTGGIYGTVISVDAKTDKVVLRVDDERGVKLAFTRASVGRVIESSSEKPAEAHLMYHAIDATPQITAFSDMIEVIAQGGPSFESSLRRPRESAGTDTPGLERTTMMKRFGWKIGVDRCGSPLLGLAFMWPPQKKLKLGIDLSGGTILVYEVTATTCPPASTWTS